MSVAIGSAFLLGIFGSLHCLGMCGPLVMSLPFQNLGTNKTWFANLSYHLGKTSTYALMGTVAGVIGEGFVLLKWQQSLSILAGIILLLITIVPIVKQKLQFQLPLQSQFAKLYAKLAQNPKLCYFFGFGFLNGLLPCGLVYAALAAATVSGTAFDGLIFMMSFGLGTMPALTAIGVFKNKLPVSWRKQMFRSSYYLSLVVGILLILRGLNLGIPYVSPSFDANTHEVTCAHPGS